MFTVVEHWQIKRFLGRNTHAEHNETIAFTSILTVLLAACTETTSYKTAKKHDKQHSFRYNPEQLERILLHLLENAAEYTPAGGKIWLDFKKRGAHTHQFIVSDTGCGVPEEQRENIFKPFTEVKDLTLGDGLGLPICSLIATKMNGSLTLDTGYSKGARFVLELHA